MCLSESEEVLFGLLMVTTQYVTKINVSNTERMNKGPYFYLEMQVIKKTSKLFLFLFYYYYHGLNWLLPRRQLNAPIGRYSRVWSIFLQGTES